MTPVSRTVTKVPGSIVPVRVEVDAAVDVRGLGVAAAEVHLGLAVEALAQHLPLRAQDGFVVARR